MCVLLITKLLKGSEGRVCKSVNHSSCVAVITLTDSQSLCDKLFLVACLNM